MAFLCPVRIPRRRRKKRDAENSSKNGAPKGRITGSNSIDSLVGIAKKEEDDDSDFEPQKMVVLHDFIPCVEDEVSVKRGEHVKALYQENDWIYVVKGDSKEGFIPFTYCVLEEEYDKRKEKIKAASLQKKNSPLRDSVVTLHDLQPAQFAKQSYGEFVVKFDFDAIDEDDITVKKGDIVVVLNRDDQDWYWVRKKSGREGFIPKDFVTKIEQITSSKSLANSGMYL
ncbi:hypothetical protein QZH41_019702 [Actinostola sp. cb2023]|nr:hypothetical protein QZH41_019702 [Actinostola sp. cb2023]